MGSLGRSMEVPDKNSPMWVYPKSLGLGPSQRWGHSACYFHGVIYVFGGCSGGLHFSDVLALNLTTMTWTTLATTGQGPGPRDSHSALVVGHKMMVFGGTDGSKKVNDLHMLDLLSKEWTEPVCSGTPPSPRESHTSLLIGDDKLVIFGGSGEGEANYLNDLYVLNLKCMRWSSVEVKGEIPVPRDSHGAVGVGSKMFVYGGDCGDRYNGDVHVFDTDKMTWSRMTVQGSSPGVRAGHAMVNIGAKVYIIGGVGDKCYYNDVWVLNVIDCEWNQLEVHHRQPQGRFSHTAVVTDSDIAIYGGCGEDERPLDELLVLQLGANHTLGRYNISTSKLSKSHWNGKRRFLRDVESKPNTMLFGNKVEVGQRREVHQNDLDSKPAFQYGLDLLHPKRRRTSNSQTLELKPEHRNSPIQMSQNSSSSHSDQERSPIARKTYHQPGQISHGVPLFKHRNLMTSNFELSDSKPCLNAAKLSPRSSPFAEEHQPLQRNEQFDHGQQRIVEAGHVQFHMVGSEVHGKVDAAFDSGYLMTAVVNGRIFRGVLFAPAPCIPLRGKPLGQAPSPMPSSSIPVARPVHYSNFFDSDYLKPINNSVINPLGHHWQPLHANQRSPISASSSPPTNKEAEKVRCDLQGVVLTLGGPGSSPDDP